MDAGPIVAQAVELLPEQSDEEDPLGRSKGATLKSCLPLKAATCLLKSCLIG
jgi:hypothetical protein